PRSGRSSAQRRRCEREKALRRSRSACIGMCRGNAESACAVQGLWERLEGRDLSKRGKHFGPWVRPRARPSGHERNQINKKSYILFFKRHCSGEQAPALRNKKGNFYFILFILLTAKVYEKPMLKIFRSEEHTSELQSRFDLVCRLLLE